MDVSGKAQGIHDHPHRKLGRRPPSRRVALEIGHYLTGKIPEHPKRVDHFAHPGLSFGLYNNDRFGVCGPTSVANHRRLVTSWLSPSMRVPTQDDVDDLYRRSGNPDFNPDTGADDNGVDMQTMLEAIARDGLSGTRCVAFARVNAQHPAELEAAVALFGAVLYGVTLDVAQQTQTDHHQWTYAPSEVWGGHAVMGGKYLSCPERDSVITWAEEVAMTASFREHQVDECWAVIWPEHLGTRSFLEGISISNLAADYLALTGRILPINPKA